MIKYKKPENLNGTELRNELKNAGIDISNDRTSVSVESDGWLYLDIDPINENKAKAIVDSHNGTMIAPEPTIQDKLAALGLTSDDLKAALGL